MTQAVNVAPEFRVALAVRQVDGVRQDQVEHVPHDIRLAHDCAESTGRVTAQFGAGDVAHRHLAVEALEVGQAELAGDELVLVGFEAAAGQVAVKVDGPYAIEFGLSGQRELQFGLFKVTREHGFDHELLLIFCKEGIFRLGTEVRCGIELLYSFCDHFSSLPSLDWHVHAKP